MEAKLSIYCSFKLLTSLGIGPEKIWEIQMANELFKEEAAGDDLKAAILKLMKVIKDEQNTQRA